MSKNFYLIFIFIFLICIVYLQATTFPVVDEFDYSSLFAESVLAIISTTILYLLKELEKRPFLFHSFSLGFTLLTVSFLNDTLDEYFEQTDFFNLILEDLTQIGGFVCVLFGVRQWLKKNRANYQALKEIADTDELTGLYTRRYLYSKVEKALKHYQEIETNFCLIMMDIDHFKQINDTKGHLVGDMVLREFGQRVEHSIRKTDLVGRWGGEEFLLFAFDTNIKDGLVLAEKIQKKITGAEFEVDGVALSVTTSMGLIQVDNADDSVETMLKRVDDLLYQAKREGRNRISH